MKRYIIVGLGKANKKIKPASFYQLGSKLASKCNVEKTQNVSIIFPPQLAESIVNDTSNSTSGELNEKLSSHFSDMACQFYTTLYSDNRYRTRDNKKFPAEKLSSVKFILDMECDDSEAKNESIDITSALVEGKNIARGLYLAKDIVNAPHNVLNSDSLADTARKVAKESNGLIQCNILGKEECEKRGMGAFLGVARGSETDPQFIHLVYKGEGEIK